ncbi:hypothetical protein DPX16_21863 [Anabarilius grahami]|uniref:Uncharacterized protein n=1 Tax=Anabarilius grahami TaxID=495550 RepID=A0A3N0YBW3_ANAGA|nr:hypothetical protein DPX16_21863 [Anabarilius grahami]
MGALKSRQWWSPPEPADGSLPCEERRFGVEWGRRCSALVIVVFQLLSGFGAVASPGPANTAGGIRCSPPPNQRRAPVEPWDWRPLVEKEKWRGMWKCALVMLSKECWRVFVEVRRRDLGTDPGCSFWLFRRNDGEQANLEQIRHRVTHRRRGEHRETGKTLETACAFTAGSVVMGEELWREGCSAAESKGE